MPSRSDEMLGLRRREAWAEIHVAAGTALGASHRRSETPNQDAYDYQPRLPDQAKPFVATVADGHGSAKSFRSDQGSRFAVAAAVEVLRAHPLPVPPQPSGPCDPAIFEQHLRTLTQRWEELVHQHLGANPLEQDEKLAELEEQGKAGIRTELERNPLLAYGSTVLVLVVTNDGLYYLQLGDGDIMTVAADEQVRHPVPGDPRLLGNETTSLCLPNAWKQFRTSWDRAEDAPRLVLLSTDGYANSFESDEAFRQVGPDLLRMIDQDGLGTVEAGLPEWLAETTELGAGDDVTLAVVSLHPHGQQFARRAGPSRRATPSPWRRLTRAAGMAPADSPLEVQVGDQLYLLGNLDQPATIGRAEDARIRIEKRHSSVSRHHAVVRLTPDGWLIEEDKGKFGIYHNGRQISRLVVSRPETVRLGNQETGVDLRLSPVTPKLVSIPRTVQPLMLAGLALVLAVVSFGVVSWLRSGNTARTVSSATSPPAPSGTTTEPGLVAVPAAAVRIAPNDPNGQPINDRFGSGVLVTGDGQLVTTVDAVQTAADQSRPAVEATKVTVEVIGSGELYIGTVQKRDPSLGLAVVKLDAPASPLPHVDLDQSQPPKQGDELIVAASADGAPGATKAQTAKMVGFSEDPALPSPQGWINSNPPLVSSGTGGTPVADRAGRLVGILTAPQPGGGAVPGLRPAALIRQLLSG